MSTHSVRIPEHTYAAVSERAAAERRSVTNMVDVLLTLALVTEVKIVPADWPPSADVTPEPSQAEKDWATGDPIPELEPEELSKPMFVPVDDPARHFRPDFKK